MTSARDRTALVILGAHRSGTSLLAGCCRLLGVEFGPKLLASQPDNIKGFFEHPDIVETHDAMFAHCGFPWHDPLPLPPDWHNDPRIESLRQSILRSLEAFGDAPLWGVKDPRMARLLPAWWPVFERLRSAPRFALLVRHPSAAAASLRARDQFPLGRSALLWLRHALEAELETRQHPRAWVHFDDLLEDPIRTLEQLGERLGLAWPVPLEHATAALREFVDGSLNHHRSAAVKDGPPEGGPWIARAYEILSRLAQDPFSAGVDDLEAIRTDLAAADAIFAPTLRRLSDEVQVLAHLGTKSSAPLSEKLPSLLESNLLLMQRCGELEGKCAELRARISELLSELPARNIESSPTIAPERTRSDRS